MSSLILVGTRIVVLVLMERFDMTELKPCPHCGSVDISNATTSLAYCLRCLDCRAEMRSFVSIDDAVNKWNRRV
ncbi:Lar family restriction alleviation protein [Cernens ardua]|uniref:Lar family restriction alleviation protein n=1 Tax=Cernens ardua TaxID=3402176 RepID=UPI003F991047